MYYSKKHIYLYLFVVLFFLLGACDLQKTEKSSLYFDTEKFISAEIELLLEEVKYVNVSLDLDGIIESKDSVEVDSASFDEISKLLKQANINKGIFKDEYTLDTLMMLDPTSNAEVSVATYSTTNNDLDVKWLQVYKNGSIKALIKNKNVLFSYEKEIYYERGVKFSVNSWQKTLSQDSIHVLKEVVFL